MLKCLVSENDTVVETLLSESVLEEEYLQEEVRKLSYLRTLRHRDTIWRTRIKMQRNENTTHCQGADWHGSLARGGGSPPLQGSKCERMSWHSCHSKIQTRENKRFFCSFGTSLCCRQQLFSLSSGEKPKTRVFVLARIGWFSIFTFSHLNLMT